MINQFGYFPIHYWPDNYFPVSYWPGVVVTATAGQQRKITKGGTILLKIVPNDDEEVLLMYMEM